MHSRLCTHFICLLPYNSISCLSLFPVVGLVCCRFRHLCSHPVHSSILFDIVFTSTDASLAEHTEYIIWHSVRIWRFLHVIYYCTAVTWSIHRTENGVLSLKYYTLHNKLFITPREPSFHNLYEFSRTM